MARSSEGRRRALVAVLLLAALAVAWWAARRVQEGPVVVRREPLGVMGTSCTLVAVLPVGDAARGAEVLQAAEDELRRLEGLLSTWIDASEVSGLNRAPAGEEVPLSSDSLAVLRRARELYRQTSGAFDITAGPLIGGWRAAAEAGRLPGAEELQALRVSSRWQDLELGDAGAVKARATARVDIDGIAKGYAIDLAAVAMRRAGAAGGLVEVGGDLRVFGESPVGDGWPVAIHDPSAEDPAAEIEIVEGAVCTSGGYARFEEIRGLRYSHILDPRTGEPVERVVSATVVAAETATADAWATALSVLGPAGVGDLPAGVEALLMIDDDGETRVEATPGFPALTGEVGSRVRRAG